MDSTRLRDEARQIAEQLIETKALNGGLFVIGCSTSEIAGQRIGTAGNLELASIVHEMAQMIASQTKADLAFQCCEHLNRAIVVEREVARYHRLREVSAIPVRKAGGSMAAYAFSKMTDPVLVETIEADAGMDIGDTLIGMHLKRVAVPLRIEQKSLGHAHILAANTRPPLIGGARAVYERDQAEGFCE